MTRQSIRTHEGDEAPSLEFDASETDAQLDQKQAFLVRSAELLHQHGTPAYRLERVISTVAARLGVFATVLHTPTALVLSLRHGSQERTYLRRINSGDIDVSKLMAFDAILDRVTDQADSLRNALDQLEQVADSGPAFSPLTTTIASGLTCLSVAALFGGGVAEIVTALVLGIVITGLTFLTGSLVAEAGLLEPLAGFLVAVLAVLAAQYITPMDDRLVTLAALILPVPGLTLTIALTELALGHLSSGSARLSGAAVRLITLVMGVALGWNLIPGGMHPAGQPPFVVSAPGAEWWLWVAVLVAPITFGILFRVPVNQWGFVVLVSAGGYLTAHTLNARMSPAVGSFCAAVVVGCLSNLYARLMNRPAMAVQTPGLLILVPGSLGYRSLTALLESETLRGVELAFAMILAGGSLVGGLLVANLLLPPKRIL